MIPSRRVLLLAMLLWMTASNPAFAVGASALKSFLKYLSKEAVSETTEKLLKEAGQETVERLTARTLKEGGEASLEQMAKMTAAHGPDVLRALDNAPNVKPLLNALEQLPPSDISKAAARLSSGAQGKELAETTMQYGVTALRSEVSHPGIGGRLVKTLGNDGAVLCGKLTTDQAIAIGRYSDDIAKLASPQRSDVLALIEKDKDRFFDFLGRFIEANPGKTLFSASTMAVLLSNSERLLGGDEIVYRPDGTPTIATKPGLFGRAGGGLYNLIVELLSGPIQWIAIVISATIAAFTSLKMWVLYRRSKPSRVD